VFALLAVIVRGMHIGRVREWGWGGGKKEVARVKHEVERPTPVGTQNREGGEREGHSVSLPFAFARDSPPINQLTNRT